MMNDSIQINSTDEEVLNDLFNSYKSKIFKLSSEIEAEDKALAPIQEIMKDENYLTERPIQNRLEYKKRLGKFIEIIERYVI